MTDDRDREVFGKAKHVCHVIKMRVGQQDMRGPLGGGIMLAVVQHRVAGKPRVDEEGGLARFQTKAAVT